MTTEAKSPALAPDGASVSELKRDVASAVEAAQVEAAWREFRGV
jgi:hypothetical protein